METSMETSMETKQPISENEAIGRLTQLWGMFKNSDPRMGEALKFAIDTLSNPDFSDTIKQVAPAMARLKNILDHTGCADDGETIYQKVEDPAEVYAILWTAYAMGKEDLAAFMDNLKDSTNGRTICGAPVYPVISWDEVTEEGGYATLETPEGTLWLDVAIHLT